MDRVEAPAKLFRFGLFEADAGQNTLTRKAVPVKIQDQPFRVLLMLLERPGEIVTREELRLKLWPEGTYVDFDGSLNVILKKLRATINDDSDNPRFIETVPRRGYRFIAPVSVEEPPTPTEQSQEQLAARHTDPPPQKNHVERIWPWALSFILIAAIFLWWRHTHKTSESVAASQRIIAVLPFSNEGAGPDFEYLRFAIANDLVTDLTHSQYVAVRPFASTVRYGSQPIDPAAAGAELGVTHVLAGGFLVQGSNLQVNMELVDVTKNQAVWRDQITVPSKELIALHDRMADHTAQSLLPAISVPASPDMGEPAPKNEQALELFLHSVTVPLDPEPNKTAIQKLEQAVSLDPGYAPAWEELGWRYYIAYHYGNGGQPALTKAIQAYKRAQDNDPTGIVNTITIQAEEGDLNGAYDQALNLLRKRPEVGSLHYEKSYVLRYAGLLNEAQKECTTALTLDPGYAVYRSCATPFILTGDYKDAQVFIHLDPNSGYGAMLRMWIALRTNNPVTALAESSSLPQKGYRFADLVRLQLNNASRAELTKAAKQLEIDSESSRDPEEMFRDAEALSFAGQSDSALRELRKAIEAHYCSVPAMDSDPLFDAIRDRADFSELRKLGIRCQQRFQAHVNQTTATIR
jgi:DNA-binding winged helix-turn-helix (wHTH) protein/TolB-like protein/tetratricopeptide (TPR) repeat protein